MKAVVLLQVKPLKEGWDHIRALDEVENWVERNRVVSKDDHVYYTSCAQVCWDWVDMLTPMGLDL